MARPPNGRLSLIASQSDSANPVSHTKCTGKHPFVFHHSTCRCAMPSPAALSTRPPCAQITNGTGCWRPSRKVGRTVSKSLSTSARVLR